MTRGMTDVEDSDQVEKKNEEEKQCSDKQSQVHDNSQGGKKETTKVTIGTKIRKEIVTLLLRMIFLQMSMNIEMNSTTWIELHTTEDLQEEKWVD